MKNNNNHYKSITFGLIGHIPPYLLDDFKEYLRQYTDFRIIKIVTSDNKLWIVQQQEGDDSF